MRSKEANDYHHKIVEVYKGYEVVHYLQRGGNTDYYYVGNGGERLSILCLGSPSGCKNVINTFLRNKVNPIYK